MSTMIKAIFNLLQRCHHRRLTRPVAPIRRRGMPQGESYVVCLDCGRHFAYDTLQMRMGEPLEQHHGGMPDRAMQG